MGRIGWVGLVFALGAFTGGFAADDGGAKPMGSSGPPSPIRDNSFLIEEAYNQEEGVVQHISTFSRDRDSGAWMYSFTQEWPIKGERHQLSYTLLLQGAGPEGTVRTGLGDTAINYRLQAIGGSGRSAFAPRLSVLFPTGDETSGRGAGSTGIQINLPLSLQLSRTFVTHTNAGITLLPSVRSPAGDSARTTSLFVGEGIVWQVRPSFNLMLEALWSRTQEVIGPGTTAPIEELLVSPGFRVAINRPSGLQIVPGLAAPIGVGSARGESGLFVYLSFEHAIHGGAF